MSNQVQSGERYIILEGSGLRTSLIIFINFRLLAVDDKLRQCADIFLESLSCLTLDEQTDLARFLVPKVRHGIKFTRKNLRDQTRFCKYTCTCLSRTFGFEM